MGQNFGYYTHVQQSDTVELIRLNKMSVITLEEWEKLTASVGS